MNRTSKIRKNPLEWGVFGISLLVVAGMLGYTIYDAATVGEDPPQIEITLGETEARGNSYAIPVSVTNHGDLTAEDVRVQVDLEMGGGGPPESATLDLAYVPRGATHKGWVAFIADPRTAQKINAYAASFREP